MSQENTIPNTPDSPTPNPASTEVTPTAAPVQAPAPTDSTVTLSFPQAVSIIKDAALRYTRAEKGLLDAEVRAQEATARAAVIQADAESLQLKIIEAEHEANKAQADIERSELAMKAASEQHQEALAVLAQAQRYVDDTAQMVIQARREHDAIFPKVAEHFVAVHTNRLEYEKFKTLATKEHLNAGAALGIAQNLIVKTKLELIEAKKKILGIPQIASVWKEVIALLEDTSSDRGGDQ